MRDLILTTRSELLVRDKMLDKLKQWAGVDLGTVAGPSPLEGVPIKASNHLPKTMKDAAGIERELIAVVVEQVPMLAMLDEHFGRPQKVPRYQFLLGAKAA